MSAERSVCLEHSGMIVRIKELENRADKAEKNVDEIKGIVSKGIGMIILISALMPIIIQIGLSKGWF